jgi:hypothetical protein
MTADLSVADEVGKLAHLRDAGALTEDEFQVEKARVLLGAATPPAPPVGADVSSRPPAVAASANSASDDKAGAFIALAGGALLAISGFLPWFTASVLDVSVSRNGMQLGSGGGFSVDGLVVLLLGLEVLLVGIGRLAGFSMPRYLQRSPIVAGAVAAIWTGLDIPGINNLVNQVRSGSSVVTAAIGFGVFVAIVGGLISILGGAVLRNTRPPGAQGAYGGAPLAGTTADRVCVYADPHGSGGLCGRTAVGIDGRSEWACEEHHRGLWMWRDEGVRSATPTAEPFADLHVERNLPPT